MKNTKTHDIIVWGAAIIAFLTGIGLCIAGFYAPPIGDINGSVLTATGEFLTFFGSVFGIGKYTEMQIEKIKNHNGDNKE